VTAETATPLEAALRTALEERLSGSPEWLATRRRSAWAAYSELPFPSSARDEDWRRTPINRLELERFDVTAEAGDDAIALCRERRDAAAADAAFFVDAPEGVRGVHGAEPLTAQGLIIEPLRDAARLHPELVARGLEHVAPGDSHFTAMWNALWEGGVFVYVPRGVSAMVPLWVAHAAAEGGLSFPGLVVVLDDDARLTLVEDHVSASGRTHAAVGVTATTLGSGARLDHVVVQDWSAQAWHVGLLRARQLGGSRLRLYGASLGGHVQKAWWETVMEGAGGEAEVNAIAFIDAEQHLDHQSLQAHHAPDTTSRLLLKTAVRGSGRSIYSGLIDVEPQAVRADGYVANRNLLLSRGARASGIPRLEIKANDVRCGHGATVGHIDDDERFYLESRGIAASEAERIIVRGFFADVIDRTPHEGVRDWIAGLVEAEIGDIVA
jgi:Fe-S cluster assembly protein SufD